METKTERAETPELARFRERVVEFFEASARARREPMPGDDEGEDDHPGATAWSLEQNREFQAKLFDAGLAGITWPREYGGQGLTNEHQRVYNEVAGAYEYPAGVFTIGLGMVMPTLLEFGTEEQKRRYVAKALRGEEIWSQLFSEPGAGSDVASLQTRAVRDGDEWTINGQKVWTTGAQHSDFGAVICRTNVDVPKHRGITMFIISFRDPGVTVKPLRQMNGGAGFNEVFFDDVRVPSANIVGEVDDGWRCAVAMLMNERVAIGSGGGSARRSSGTGIEAFSRLAGGRGLLGDPVYRQALADVYTRQRIMGFVAQRTRAALQAGRAPGPEGSTGKLGGAQLSRRSSDLGVAMAGPAGVAWSADDPQAARWAQAVLSSPSSRIAGGTDEVQRNIIGERVLGLPKEPQVDRDVPFRELKVGTQRPD